MTTLSQYLQTWRLKLSRSQTVTTACHLNNGEVKRELAVYISNNLLPFFSVPNYFKIKVDRFLTLCHQIEASCKKKKKKLLIARLKRLARLGWGANAKTLRIAALSLMVFTLHLSTVQKPRVVLLILASLTMLLTTPCALSLNACIPYQRAFCQFQQVSNQQLPNQRDLLLIFDKRSTLSLA